MIKTAFAQEDSLIYKVAWYKLAAWRLSSGIMDAEMRKD